MQALRKQFWQASGLSKLRSCLPSERKGQWKNNPWGRALRGHSQPSDFHGNAQTIRWARYRSGPLWPMRARIHNSVGNSVGSTSASLAKGPRPIEQGGQAYTHAHGQATGQSHSWAHAKAVTSTSAPVPVANMSGFASEPTGKQSRPQRRRSGKVG